MNLLQKLRQQQTQPLLPNPVAVPELAHLFEAGESTVFYIASLTAMEKDEMDAAFIDFCKRSEVSEKNEREIWRSFMVAYCLCDSKNVRIATSVKELDELVILIAGTGNRVISRLWVVCNGANRLIGVDEVLKKSSEVTEPKTKSDDGNGESHFTSDFHQDPLG